MRPGIPEDMVGCDRYYSKMLGDRVIIELSFSPKEPIKEFYYLTPSSFLVTDTQLKVDSGVIEYRGECYYRNTPTAGHMRFYDAYITIDSIDQYIRYHFVDTPRHIIEEMIVAVQRVISFHVL